MEFSKDKFVGEYFVKRNISEDDIDTVIVNGFEGGINYWAGLNNSTPEWKDRPQGTPLSSWATKLLLEGKEVVLYDREEESETWTLTLEKLISGFQINAERRPFDSIENGDAVTADCIIQYALFGEIAFG